MDRLVRIDARDTRRKRNLNEESVPSVEKPEVESIIGEKRAKFSGKLNKLDPIMLTPLRKKDTFKFVRPNGSCVVFNIDTLVDYILSTGDFSDPETRIAFSDEDLETIDKLVHL
jgi:hypothetical protein